MESNVVGLASMDRSSRPDLVSINFYRTVDQRNLEDEAFIERMRERVENRILDPPKTLTTMPSIHPISLP
jgi:hypothetical protein